MYTNVIFIKLIKMNHQNKHPLDIQGHHKNHHQNQNQKSNLVHQHVQEFLHGNKISKTI